MVAIAQGNGDPNSNGDGKGFNPPSIIGMSVGAPYLHAGQARTLEALFSEIFSAHYAALSTNFLQETGQARADKIEQLVHAPPTSPAVFFPSLLC